MISFLIQDCLIYFKIIQRLLIQDENIRFNAVDVSASLVIKISVMSAYWISREYLKSVYLFLSERNL